MKKISMNLFVILNILFMFFEVKSSADKNLKKNKSVADINYLETEFDALERDALNSQFKPFFAPENKILDDQDEIEFSDSNYPGLKHCQNVWKKFIIHDEGASTMVDRLLLESEEDSAYFAKIPHSIDIPLSIVVAGLSSSPTSELSGSSSGGATTFDSPIESNQSAKLFKMLSPAESKKIKIVEARKAKKQRQQLRKFQQNEVNRLKEDEENALIEEACKESARLKHSLHFEHCGLSRAGLSDSVIYRDSMGKIAVVLPVEDDFLYALVLKLLDQIIKDLHNDFSAGTSIDYDSDILAEIMYQSLFEYLQSNNSVKSDVLSRVASLNELIMNCLGTLDHASSKNYREYLTYVDEYAMKSLKIIAMLEL